jgi:hypothetical protein
VLIDSASMMRQQGSEMADSRENPIFILLSTHAFLHSRCGTPFY